MEIVRAAQLLSASEVSPCGKFGGGGGWVEWSRALGTQKLQALSQEYSSAKTDYTASRKKYSKKYNLKQGKVTNIKLLWGFGS